MTELEQLKRVIKQSSDLSRGGQDLQALALLDESLTLAIRENRAMWIRILSHHAAVISDSMGDAFRVRQYYERSLAANPDNPMALYGLAKALQRLGEAELAKEYATRSYRAVQHNDGALERGLIELIAATWPEIRESGQ